MHRTFRTRAATAVAAVVLACLSAPAADKPAATFVGTLPGEPAGRIAVVLEGDAFLAYACGKTDEFNQAHSAWFKGIVTDGRLAAVVGDKTLSATVERGLIRGSLKTAGDRDREFTAKPVPPTAVAGLYRAAREVNGDTLVFGWIVDAKHQVVGGCQGKKRKAVALKTAPLPPPPPADQDPPPEQKQEAEQLLVQQVDEEPEVAVQGEKVTSAVKPPAGKVVRGKK